jgi:cytochrome b561
MIEIVYFTFFWALIVEVAIFFLLTVASPTGIKGKIISMFTTHKSIGYVLYVHLAFCILAAFFFIDLSQ